MTSMRKYICVLYLLAAVGISSCGVSIKAAGDFTVAATPGTQTSGGGGSTKFTVTITNTGEFSGNVALSASGLPAGATASFSPSAVLGTGTSTLTILTSSSTPAANSMVTITGMSGNLNHSAAPVTLVTINAGTIIGQMTQSEDSTELHGIQDTNDYRVVPGISALGIPLLNITNGPAGVTNGGPGHAGSATALPAPIALAATWDKNLANLYGTVVGSEAYNLANGFLEGPDVNIARTLQNGRTFESFGEDPYLTGQMAVAEIEGIQSQGVIAEAKHFAANNQEANRTTVNEIIDERTLREIYLPAFENSVEEGGAGAVMCAYNMVNGTYMCENNYLLNEILKTQWGFTGFVTSDFGATHSTVASANSGLDLEMPTGIYFTTAPLETAITNSEIPQATINGMLQRRFLTMMRFNIFPTPPAFTGISAAAETANGVTAREIAEAGMVLLKNSGKTLPLNASSLHTIAVIGPYAGAAMTGGGGSSKVVPLYSVAPVAGIQNRVGSGVTVTYANGSSIPAAVTLAQAVNVVIVMVGDSEAEGADDPISLSGNQNALVQAIVTANPNTIVVMKSGTSILMPWASSVPAILQAWYPGEEDGNAVAAVLFGDVNPSGKLPLTIPVSASDPAPPADGSAPSQYPGVLVGSVPTATYSEGVFVGYRHYDESNITPLFPFGFGLSYTTFSFSNLSISPLSFTFTGNPNQSVTVSFNVMNTGNVAGAEVAQVYVGIPSTAVPEPPKWLKGFQKVTLTPGQTNQVQVTLNMRSFAYWDITSESWKVVPGTYQIMVGDSSRNIELQSAVTIN